MSSNDECWPLAKQLEVASTCQIDQLADVDLAEIFKWLPPLDCLFISEVCKRWHAVAKKAWLETTHLDLSLIPGTNLAPIIRLCPNLRTVSAARKTFNSNELHILSRIALSSLNLHECTRIHTPAIIEISCDALHAIFSNDLRSTSWDELIHELAINFVGSGDTDFPASFPTSLKRLQLSGVSFSPQGCYPCLVLAGSLRGIELLRQLECLILLSRRNDVVIWSALGDRQLPARLALLQNLRELALGSDLRWGHAANNLGPLLSLPRLETLFLDYFAHLHDHPDDFDKLVTQHPTLRVLVLTGYAGLNVQFPMRRRYGNGFSADPVPQLHIFVGKSASENIQFPKFTSDAAKVYPISEPLPLFLDREDIKPIFDGVWIAEKIKAAAKHGAKFCDYHGDLATSFRSSDT